MRILVTAFILLSGTAWACPEGEPPPAADASLRWATDDPPAEAWIISPSEAELPLGRQLVPEKSDPDGPRVTVRDPGEINEVSPPVTIDIAFQADEDAAVDFKTLKVTYL